MACAFKIRFPVLKNWFLVAFSIKVALIIYDSTLESRVARWLNGWMAGSSSINSKSCVLNKIHFDTFGSLLE